MGAMSVGRSDIYRVAKTVLAVMLGCACLVETGLAWDPPGPTRFYNQSYETISISCYQIREIGSTEPLPPPTQSEQSGFFAEEQREYGVGQNERNTYRELTWWEEACVYCWCYRAPIGTSNKWVFTGVSCEDDGAYNAGPIIVNTEGGRPGNSDNETRDPINTINGAVLVSETDMVVPCPGLSLGFGREYNSALDHSGALGYRWRHTYEWSISQSNTVESGSTVTNLIVSTGGGRQFWFRLSNGAYEGPIDNDWSLDELTNGTRVVTIPGVSACWFDTNGVLTAMSDEWGNQLTFSYTNSYPSNLLAQIEHSNGQYLEFEHTGNLLTKIEAPSTTNFWVSYSYNGQDELTNVTRHISGLSQTTTYLYDCATNYCNHSLTQRVNAAGDVFKYGYTTNGAGQITSVGTSVILGTNYYSHTVELSTNGTETQVAYYLRGTNQWYTHEYDTNMNRLTAIYGPSSSNQWTTFINGPNGDVAERHVIDNDADEASYLLRGYDDHHNVTNEAFGYDQWPTNYSIYAWDTNDNVLTLLTDPEGHKIAFEYTNASLSKAKLYYNPTSFYETIFTHTTNGLLASVTNANNHWVKHYYDSHGFPTSTVPQAGPTINYVYSQLGHLTSLMMPKSGGTRTTSLNVNELGWVNSITYPDSTSESFSYDKLGNLTNHVDTMGRTNTYTYLPTRKLSSATRVLTGASNQNVTTSFTYDQQFNTLKIEDAEDRIVEAYVLDIQDRPTTVTNVEGQTMSITYGLGQYVKSITRFDGSSVSNSYNAQGLLSEIKYSDDTNTFTYLKNNLLSTAANALGTVSNTYNFANRLTASLGVMTSGQVDYTYLPAGQVSNVTSVAGATTYSYDAAERAQAISAPNGLFTNSYNAYNGLLSSMLCTNSGVSVSYGYDDMDRLTNILWIDSSTNTIRSFAYSYNNAGMITNVALEDSSSIQYTYDSLDRLTGEKKIDGDAVTTYEAAYSYDLVGNRTQKAISEITVAYTVPSTNNRMSSWTASVGSNAVALVDVYGKSSETVGVNSALGQLWVSNIVTRTPDVSGTNFWCHALPLGFGGQQIIAAIGDEAGNVGYATNVVTAVLVTNATYGYNAAGCITNITYAGANYTQETDIAWNQQYQITSVCNNGDEVEAYQYDAVGRRVLIMAPGADNAVTNGGFNVAAGWNLGSGWSITNGTAKHLGSVGTGALYQDTNVDMRDQTWVVSFRGKQTTGPSNYVRVYLGVNGTSNLKQIWAQTINHSAWWNYSVEVVCDDSYAWDTIVIYSYAEQSPGIEEIVLLDDIQVTRKYDKTHIVHDGIHPVAEVDTDGNLQKSYTWGPGIDNLLAYTDHTVTNTYYMITDHLGTVHAVVNSSGSVVESYRYDAWGRVLGVYDSNGQPLSESAIDNNYLWQGRWYSWKTGLYFFRARWYDPITGRWLSKDPIGISGGLNQYVFVNNCPTMFRDPLGLCRKKSNEVDHMLQNLRIFIDAEEKVARDTLWPAWFVKGLGAFALHSGLPGTPLDVAVNGRFQYIVEGERMTGAQFGNYLAGYHAGYAKSGGILMGMHAGGMAWAGLSDGLIRFVTLNQKSYGETLLDEASTPYISAGFAAGYRDRMKNEE